MVAARPESGHGLDAALRGGLEATFGADLAAVRVFAGPGADRLNRRRGTLALARGDDLYFRAGWYAPDTAWGRWLIAHEVAHALQMRGAARRTDAPAGLRAELEAEANEAAAAAVLGRRVRVRPRPVCPAEQPVAPIVLMAVAAGLVLLWPKDIGPEPTTPGGAIPEQKHLYETGWGYCPIVGSLDQMINGRNWFSQLTGAAFFVMDMTMVGGLARMAVKGVYFKLTQAAQTALRRSATEATVNSVQRRSYAELMKSGAVKTLTQAQAEAELKALATAGQTAVVVGTQSGKAGVYHSIMYAIVDGKVYRLHGGMMKKAASVVGLTAEESLEKGLAKGWNSFTVYSANELAEKGITDQALKAVAEGWGKQFPGMLGPLKNVCAARGCASSQWLLMNQLGLSSGVAAESAGRYIPYLMETSRLSTGFGSHFVIDAVRSRAAWGTFAQFGMAGAMGGIYTFGSGLQRAGMDPIADPLAAWLAGGQSGPVSASPLMLPEGLQTQLAGATAFAPGQVVLVPADGFDLGGVAAGFPGGDQFTAELGDGAVIDLSSRRDPGLRVPIVGGAKLPPVSLGR